MTAVIFAGVPIVSAVPFRRVYYEALDLIISVIDKCFKQESFSSYAQIETLLVKVANSDGYESDVDTGMLPGQLSVLLAMLKISCFDNPVDNILVMSILVTNMLVMKVPEPEKKG